jgi:ribose transport system permease protein
VVTHDTIEQAATGAVEGRSTRALRPMLARYGVILAMIATFAAFSATKPDAFFTVITLKAILRDASPLLVLALGATVVLVMNEFDLSIGGLLGLCGTFTVVCVSSAHFGLPIAIAVLLGICFGATMGLVNGVLIAYAGASSFIVTIGMATFFNGADLRILNSRTIFEGIPQGYVNIASGTFLGLANQVFAALVVLVVLWWLLHQSELGRYMYAIGGNKEATRLAGVRVPELLTFGFMISGACAAIAGILISSQASAANPNSGLGLLLPAYAAAFLGSTMWKPGMFTALGTLLGALFLQMIGTGLSLFSLPGSIVLMIQGGILVVAVLVSRLGRQR